MPRAGLSREAVGALAVAVVDDAGWEGLTLAAVAHRAGVAVPSLYKHVAGLPDLRRDVRLAALEHLGAALTAVPATGSRDDRVRRLATALRAYGLQHPGRYDAAQVGVAAEADPQLAGAAARVVRLLADTLGDDAATVDHVRALRALVHGFVVLETHGGFGLPDDVTASFDHAVALLLAGMGRDD